MHKWRPSYTDVRFCPLSPLEPIWRTLCYHLPQGRSSNDREVRSGGTFGLHGPIRNGKAHFFLSTVERESLMWPTAMIVCNKITEILQRTTADVEEGENIGMLL